MTEETTGRRDPFFAFDDETDERPEEPEEGRRGRAVAWKPIGVGLLGLLLGLVLAVSGALTWDDSRRIAGYADRSWVVGGQYQDLTNDLRTKDYNPVYRGVLPADPAVAEQPFDSGLADPRPVEPGEEIVFRGTQTGSREDDFHAEADALLAVEDGTLQVVATDEAGAYGEGITAGTVAWERTEAALLVLGGLAVAGAGLWWARRLWLRGA
ncbi:hypothetical protein LQU92_07815 [Kocuria sp. LUK]|uniref:Uncharacterized protein n=1 Tax=Kocuria flava TaxID=446860 RepID=A0A2N4T4A6_9MICC|nr:MULTISPECIES: hypothetical protein [Kocuria]MCD1145141.1 hypothetical protein [Kocuria sp. LUK]PLC13068.1 hypothetical protein AUQ48_13630 [Kocuria flava]